MKKRITALLLTLVVFSALSVQCFAAGITVPEPPKIIPVPPKIIPVPPKIIPVPPKIDLPVPKINIPAVSAEKPEDSAAEKEKDLPESGTVFIGEKLSKGSYLTIDCTESDVSYYIKLKDRDLNDVFAFFVRHGDTVRQKVPAGEYDVYFACGDTWIDEEEHFGENTEYSKADEYLDFNTYEYTFTLYSVVNGNFSDTDIPKSEF